MILPSPNEIAGLPTKEQEMLAKLLEVWEDKLTRNKLQEDYYNAKNRLKDMGIAIPPALQKFEMVVGWPAKAVDSLAVRARFDGFITTDENSFMDDVLEYNHFKILYQQAETSELTHSCSFLTVTAEDRGEEHPRIIMSAYTATDAAALWDRRHKRIKCGMAVVDGIRDPKTDDFEPTWVNLYTDDAVWEIKKTDTGWTSKRNRHSMGRPTMEPLVYRPSLSRPFGKSRINRAVISITDEAVRTTLRSAVAAEFHTSPQKYLLGAEDTLFEDNSTWEAYIGNIFAISKDEDGDVPQFGQLPQGSMQPHIDYMRSLAARFSGETSIPLSELGIVSDNPSSAEAIYAAKESLVIEAESVNETNGEALKVIGRMAIAFFLDKPLEELTPEEADIVPHFRNPAMPSIVSQADAMVKVVTPPGASWIAETDVYLEQMGFDEATRRRMLKEKRLIQGREMAAAILSSRSTEASDGAAVER